MHPTERPAVQCFCMTKLWIAPRCPAIVLRLSWKVVHIRPKESQNVSVLSMWSKGISAIHFFSKRPAAPRQYSDFQLCRSFSALAPSPKCDYHVLIESLPS